MELLNSIKKTMDGEAKPAQVATEKKVEATRRQNQWQTKSSSGMYI
jgi:hypothetical protein